ncbi:hypothetical protein [Rhizobium herbae]|uniref:hypothetical protein n=1 Tax=Rhizobium herbae TaxID=508661 RepID=UPI001F27A554|nr:hypothetical protein [Rhizobium herbae]
MLQSKGNPRRLRQPHYTFDQFAKKYGLSSDEARVLFAKFGPSSVELDLLMKAKGMQPVR